MTKWGRRLTILASVVALSGAPAVLSACWMVCLDVITPMATAADDVIGQHHHHHGGRGSSAPRLTGGCMSCCDGLDLAFLTGPRAERTDVAAFGMAPATVVAARVAPPTVDRAISCTGPPGLPHLPAGALVPLRI